jgi:acyl-CoA hydrolase
MYHLQNRSRLGNIVTMNAKVTRSFNSSMEVFLEVWAEDIPAGRAGEYQPRILHICSRRPKRPPDRSTARWNRKLTKKRSCISAHFAAAS